MNFQQVLERRHIKNVFFMEQEEDQQIFEKQSNRSYVLKKWRHERLHIQQNWISRYKEYRVSKSFEKILENSEFTNLLEDLIQFGKSRYERDYSDRYQDTDLVLYQKYTYEDVCRLLNWENSEVPLNIGGYKFDKKQRHSQYLSIMIKQIILVIQQNMKIILSIKIN